jgi:hypothetical protein
MGKEGNTSVSGEPGIEGFMVYLQIARLTHDA